MKKVLIGMLAIVITFSATAQGEKKNKKDVTQFRKEKFEHKQFDHGNMASKLNLTQDQKVQMKSLNESFKSQLQELKKNESLTVKEQKERREALITQHKASVEAILTPEQRQQLESRQKNGLAKKEGKNLKDEKGPKGEKLDKLKQLNLTDNQGQQIKAVNEDFRTKMQAIQKDNQLTSAQKKEQAETLQKQHTESIKAVLTAEQKAKLEELRRSRKNAK